MQGNRANLFIVIFFLLAPLVFPLKLHSEFFKYINKDGNAVFVDDIGKVPPEYRDDTKVYEEKYDHLPETERLIKIEEDQIKFEKRQDKLKAEEEQYLKSVEIKKEKPDEKQFLKSHETKVTIKGNRVLVPVTLGYGNKEIETVLLLDTGASIMLLHREIAEQLNIMRSKKAVAKLTGGKKINIHLVKLDYVKVGPLKVTGVDSGVVEHKGTPVAHKGLLGMNVLRNLDYSIDFENQVISWKPRDN